MHTKFRNHRQIALAVSLALATNASVAANETAADLEEVVVTARAGAGSMARIAASYAISTLDEQQLRTAAPTSVAELFKNVPGYWVESSGGEASDNVRTRGIPLDGYATVALQEDGLPVQQDGGLGYLNADQSFRLDRTISRVEAVRGGPSSIFASQAPGGIVNFITRRVGNQAEGEFAGEWGDYRHVRADFFYGAPFAEGWTASLGGFYRQDDGIRDPGFDGNKGGQLRFALSRELADGRLDFNIKHIDDHVSFYLPAPLTFDANGKVSAVPGFDAHYGTLVGPETQVLDMRNVNGPYRFDLTEGTHTQLTQFTFKADLGLGSGWRLQEGLRFRDSDIQRNGLFPTGNVETASSRLPGYLSALSSGFAGVTSAAYQFVSSPSTVFDVAANNGNGLVVSGNALAVHVPLREFINDTRFVKQFEFGAQKHDVAAGVYFANYDMQFIRYMSTVLLEVADNARLLNVVGLNAAGKVVGSLTENGVLRYGSLFDNAQGSGRVSAFYLSDEWQITDALRVDAGVRHEQERLNGTVEGKITTNLNVAGTLAATQVINGSGLFTPIKRDYSGNSGTVGVNYQFTHDFGAFGRYTKSFRMPNVTDFTGSPLRQDVKVTPIQMAELGVKWISEKASAYATVFQTNFNGVAFTDNIFDTTTNSYRQVFAFADTKSKGLELEGTIAPVRMFDVSVNATWQDSTYSGFVYNDLVGGVPVQRNFDGNQLIRIPKLALRVVPGVNLVDNRLRAELAFENYSERYADVANTQKLPAYSVWNANLRFSVTDQLTVSAHGLNLSNEIGLTEGNPRAGEFVAGNAGAKYFLARPIMGRSLRVDATYKF